MRRGSWQVRTALVTVLVAVLCAASPLLAKRGQPYPYDDRPTLLASESSPEGQTPASHLTAVEVVTSDDRGHAEILLKGDGGVPFEVFSLEGPNRIVFDLPGMSKSVVHDYVDVSNDGLVRVRVGQYRESPDPMARVVFDLTQPLQWSAIQEQGQLRVLLYPEGSQPIASTSQETAAPAVAEQAEAVVEQTWTESVDEAPGQVDGWVDTTEQTGTSVEPDVPAVDSDVTTMAREVYNPTPSETTQMPMAAAIVTPSETSNDVKEEVTSATWVEEVTVASETAETPAETTGEVATLNSEYAAIEETAETQAESKALAAASVADEQIAGSPDTEPWSQAEIAEAIEQAAGPADQPASVQPTALASSQGGSGSVVSLPSSQSQTIEDVRRGYNGQPITLNLVDADIKQVFSVFHEISGLNFVLDPSVSGSVTIVVDEVPWDQALDLILKNNGLDMVLEGNVIRIAPVTRLAREADERKRLVEAKELEDAPVTITRTLSYAKGQDIEVVIRDAILSPKGRVIVDTRTNTLIIRDVPTRVEAIDRLLTTLDSETPQVMIEARIVEVSRDFVKDLGIQWGSSAIADPALGTQTNLDFPHRARVDYDLNLPRAPGASALGFSFGNVLDSFTLDITLDALETEGYARRLSSPKIATQTNESAEIEQGVRIPVVSTTATEIDVTFVSASLRLKCTPQITAEGTVVLDIEVENNSPDFVNTVGDVPAINTQRAQTKVLIDDGGTTVIGGIFTINEGRSESGVPFFRKIPGLGWLFRSKNEQTRNRELLIFITPRIIKAA